MKPLKFRSWINEEMIYPNNTFWDTNAIDGNGALCHVGEQNLQFNEDGAIIMQAIGLQDVTCQDIFEGDILKHATGYVTKVQWSDKALAWEMIGEDGGRQDFAWYVGNIPNLPMVFGNIYETPEKFKMEPDEERTDPLNL